jgi:carbamoyl-phosphate synthase large subunit
VVRKHFEVGDLSGEPDTIARILDGSIDIIINTPYGVGARLDGYEIRSAAVRQGVPCITNVQGLGAAVQGIEALIRGEIRVKSLQEHAAELSAKRGAT